MILLADSGSTKCDWLLIDGDQRIDTKTMGFNPFFHSQSLIEQEINKNETLTKHKDSIKAVYYYGAGCSSPERNDILKRALSSIFTEVTDWVVEQDLVGAALAVCQGKKGIACILGTGSNSCFYDGNNVTEQVPALGFMLGDEGSGSYFGKQILSNFLYHRLPSELEKDLIEEYGLSKEGIFASVYDEPNPNVYLASFMKFVSPRKDHPYFRKMVHDGLAHFAEIHIKCFPEYKEHPVHFVGSIGYYFQDILKEVAQEAGFTVGMVVKKPIQPLADFHVKALEKSF